MSKSQTSFNAHTVVSIKVVDKKKVRDLIFYSKREKKWWRRGYEEGFGSKYGMHDTGPVWTAQDLRDGKHHKISFIVEEDTVYYQPYVEIVFVNNEREVYNCQTIEEAKKKAQLLEWEFSRAQRRLENPFVDLTNCTSGWN